jgi:MEDS: MEthanogen/methylotroph, DcmR Sensory domain
MSGAREQSDGSRAMLDHLFEMGVGGIVLNPGDHICAFYRGSEGRNEILIPYLEEGLKEGEKCICFLEIGAERLLRDQLESRTLADLMARHLSVLDFTQTYLRDGRFTQEQWFDFLDESLSAAINGEGYPCARAAGEMSWSLQKTCPGVEELCSYEAKINWFAPRYPQILLCMYDLDQFTGDVVVDVLKTHPKVLLNNMVIENPYYVDPAEFLAQQQPLSV